MKPRWIAGLAVLIVMGLAIAAHYGTFTCSDCTLEGATPDAETAAFIASTVNQKVDQWRAKDTVVVCNATACATYKMVSVTGGIASMEKVSKEPRGGSGGGTGGGGGGGSGGSWSGVGGGGCEGECDGKIIIGTVKPIKP